MRRSRWEHGTGRRPARCLACLALGLAPGNVLPPPRRRPAPPSPTRRPRFPLCARSLRARCPGRKARSRPPRRPRGHQGPAGQGVVVGEAADGCPSGAYPHHGRRLADGRRAFHIPATGATSQLMVALPHDDYHLDFGITVRPPEAPPAPHAPPGASPTTGGPHPGPPRHAGPGPQAGAHVPPAGHPSPMAQRACCWRPGLSSTLLGSRAALRRPPAPPAPREERA